MYGQVADTPPQHDKVSFLNGLRLKLLITVGLLFMLIVSVVAYFLINNETATLRRNLQREASSFAELGTNSLGSVFVVYKDSGTAQIDQAVNQYSGRDNVIENIGIVDLSGRQLYSNHKQNIINVSPAQASSFYPTNLYNHNGDIRRIIYPYFEGSGAHTYSIVYDISNQDINGRISSAVKTLIWLSSVAFILTLITTYFVINQFILRRLYKVSHQAAIISSGNLEQEIDASGDDEIAMLGLAVNNMANKLKAHISQLKTIDKTKSEFMMIVSHNLRTPLTIINGYLSEAENFQSIDQLKMVLERISLSAKRLNVFSEDVLNISQYELGDEPVESVKVDLTDLIEKLAQEFEPLAAERHLHFMAEITDQPIDTRLSWAEIRSAIWNLLDNALKFTHDGGTIKLGLTKDGQHCYIKVSDTGIGIAQDELPKLFTKFHRGTSTLTYNYEGTGIGLYASKLIILRHGGDIKVSSKEGHGSEFTIILPIR